MASEATKYGTAHIGRRAAENVLHAIRYAAEIGWPINLHITISFPPLGVEDDRAGRVFQSLKGRVCRWWADQRQRKGRGLGGFVGVHSHANPAGSRHVDWLLHVPDEAMADFLRVVKARPQKLTGRDDLGHGLHVQRVTHPGGLAKYILRGIEPEYGP